MPIVFENVTLGDISISTSEIIEIGDFLPGNINSILPVLIQGEISGSFTSGQTDFIIPILFAGGEITLDFTSGNTDFIIPIAFAGSDTTFNPKSQTNIPIMFGSQVVNSFTNNPNPFSLNLVFGSQVVNSFTDNGNLLPLPVQFRGA